MYNNNNGFGSSGFGSSGFGSSGFGSSGFGSSGFGSSGFGTGIGTGLSVTAAPACPYPSLMERGSAAFGLRSAISDLPPTWSLEQHGFRQIMPDPVTKSSIASALTRVSIAEDRWNDVSYRASGCPGSTKTIVFSDPPIGLTSVSRLTIKDGNLYNGTSRIGKIEFDGSVWNCGRKIGETKPF